GQAPDPDEAWAFLYRAMLRTRAVEDPAGAIADCGRALALEPHLTLALRERARARHAGGDLGGALRDVEAALAQLPDAANALALRGRIRAERGDPVGGLADLGRAVELNPRFSEAWANR